MPTKHTFYCWTRVVAAGSPEALEVVKPMDAGRPPKKKSNSSEKPADVDETWWVHKDHFDLPNKPTLVIRHGEAFYDETLAKAWISTLAGDAWAKSAKAYSLVTFEIELK